MGMRTFPRVALPAIFVGNARDGAPTTGTFVVVFKSTFVSRNCVLISLVSWAVRKGGRRSTQPRLQVLADSFSVIVILVDDLALAAELVAATLHPRFHSAPIHRGQGWPLDGAPPRARTAARPAGLSPSCGGQVAGAPSTCTTAASSTATWTPSPKASRDELVAVWSPTSSAGTELDVPFPHRAIRAGAGRLPAHGIIGVACGTALARASSQGAGQEGRMTSGGRRPMEEGGGPGTKEAGA